MFAEYTTADLNEEDYRLHWQLIDWPDCEFGHSFLDTHKVTAAYTWRGMSPEEQEAWALSVMYPQGVEA